ncbi:MAG: hypothetical protein NVSMB5_26350 [Candidatus Velthaea sp.]
MDHRMQHGYALLAFNDVALRVIDVAWWSLGILVLALLAAAANRFFVTVGRADDIVFEATLGLDRTSAQRFYALYLSRKPKNLAIAWFLTVLLGPIGAFAYMEQWGKFTAALFTLNGFGAWWIESWFSVPHLVLMENRRIAQSSLEQLPFVMRQDALAHA